VSGIGAALRTGLALAWRRRWAYAVPIVTALLPAALYVVHLPDVYKSTGTVAVRATSATRLAGGPTLDVRPEQILATARDRVFSTPNVEAIVPLVLPTASPKDPAAVAKTRARLSYDQIGEATGFSVSVEDRSPVRAAAIVNRLLEAFLETERSGQLELARSQLDFAEQQLGEATAKFDGARRALDEFGAAHRGVMPQDRETVSAEISRIDAEVRDLEARAASSRRLMNEYELLLRRPQTAPVSTTPGMQMSAEEFQLQTQLVAEQQASEKAKENLATLAQKYQPKWPAVIAAKDEVARLEAKVAETTRRLEEAHRRAEANASTRRTTENQGATEFYQRARDQEAAAEQRHLADAERRRGEKDALQKRLFEIPVTERALVTVKQELENAQRWLGIRDQSVQNARQQVDALSQPELAPGLIGFRIESPARAPSPDNPSGPSRARWLALAIVAGCGVGWALGFLRRRFAEGAVESPSDLADLLPGALVVAVPLYDEGRATPTTRRVTRLDAICGTWVLLLGAATVLVIAWHKTWLDVPAWFRPWLPNR
jgi:succinoglycan biosynthesis transport protein ExoP